MTMAQSVALFRQKMPHIELIYELETEKHVTIVEAPIMAMCAS